MTEALVKPELLRWARERVAMPMATLAEKLKIAPEKMVAWEAGEARPSFAQAERLADIVHVPFGYLFLPAPPEETLPIPDLRTHAGAPRDRFSADFLDFLSDTLFKHDWYRAWLETHGAERLSFVGSVSLATPVEAVAQEIRTTLRIEPGTGQSGSWEAHLAELFQKGEDAGIWVMRTGYVGSNTHRGLNTTDFRGFAVADPMAPLIVINGKDAKAAQAFTLAHELAHIWLGSSGVSDPFLGRSGEEDSDIERRCNAIAAEVLVPRASLLAAWDDRQGLLANAATLSQRFKVSRVVVARRAFDCGKVSFAAYHAFFETERSGWQSGSDGGGGNYYATIPVKNGRRFTAAVLGSAMSGDLLLRDAGALLNMKPVKVRELYARQSQEA